MGRWQGTGIVQAGLREAARSGAIERMPPVLAFQSVVDDTVDASAVDRLLFDKLAADRNELVLFDVNRNRLLQPLQLAEKTAWADALLHGTAHAHAVTMVGTTSLDDAAAVARTRRANADALAMEALGIDYPTDVFSLSHIALPFAEDDALYGRIPGRDGYYKLHRHPDARPVPGLTLVGVEGSMVFYNADSIRERLETIARHAPKDARWFVLDASTTPHVDSTAAGMLEKLRTDLAARGVTLGFAELHTEVRRLLRAAGVLKNVGKDMLFDDIEEIEPALRREMTGAPGDAG